MPRMFIVDTNVVVAGLITAQADSPTVQLLDAMLDGRLIYLLSADLLREYRTVMLRPKLARMHGLNETEIDALLTDITANALWRDPPADDLHQAPDPRDSHLWALLACDPSAVLVTGDLLLQENPRPGVSVISPAQWASDFRA
jgi:putative PIN family toxin of toxin-antitoxin system